LFSLLNAGLSSATNLRYATSSFKQKAAQFMAVTNVLSLTWRHHRLFIARGLLQ